MFRELMPILEGRTLMLTLSRVDDVTIRVCVIPKRVKDAAGENALLGPRVGRLPGVVEAVGACGVNLYLVGESVPARDVLEDALRYRRAADVSHTDEQDTYHTYDSRAWVVGDQGSVKAGAGEARLIFPNSRKQGGAHG